MEKLQLVNLVKHYSNKHAVNGINYEINEGDLIGLIGENGAGKSTTLAMIATLIKPTSGDIVLDGKSIIRSPGIMKGRIGFVPQDIALYPMLTGYENLKFWGRLYHLNKAQINKSLEEVSAMIGLDDATLKRKVGEYSGGMKSRINIGAALMHNPDIVIMDEPTVGIDVNSRNIITDTIIELNKKGKTIIYTGHYMWEIEKMCNRVCVLENGQIKCEGRMDELLNKGGTKISLEEFYMNITKEG